MLILVRYRREMALTSESFLLSRRARGDPTVAAVVANMIHSSVDHSGVVNVVNVGDVNVVYRSVVEKMAAVPASAIVAVAEIPVTVIDAAIETDLRTPVALIEDKSSAAVSPIARGPEKADSRRAHPGSWHPVVVAVIGVVSPVAGGPDVAVARTKGLFVDGKGRWSERDREDHSSRRSRGHSQDHH